MADLPLVLLVDDDEAARYIQQRLLRPYAAQIQLATADNGQAALRHLLTRPPNAGPALVLLDLNMPVMGGLAFLEARSHWPSSQQAATPVVVLSSSVLATEHEQVRALGADFIAKPLTAATLARLLQHHLQLPPPPAKKAP